LTVLANSRQASTLVFFIQNSLLFRRTATSFGLFQRTSNITPTFYLNYFKGASTFRATSTAFFQRMLVLFQKITIFVLALLQFLFVWGQS
jgi:hypothetical protein